MEQLSEAQVSTDDMTQNDSDVSIIPMDTSEAVESQIFPIVEIGQSDISGEIDESMVTAITENPVELSDSVESKVVPSDKVQPVQQLKQVVLQTVPVTQKTNQNATTVTTKQVAIAPKPVSLIRKITLSNLRPKAGVTIGTDKSGRQMVVVPASTGQIKFLKAVNTTTANAQVVSPTNPLIQLRQALNLPVSSKLTVVPDSPENSSTVQKTTPRYISLQQAQQMGIVTGGKMNQVLTLSPISQSSNTSPTVRPIRQIVPTLKSPAKILPAPLQGSTASSAKVILTSVPQNCVIKSGTKQAQVIKVDGLTTSNNTILTTIPSGQKFVRLVSSNIASQSNVQAKKVIPASPIRIAPIPASTTRLLQINAKLVPSKSPQILPKTIVIDSQDKTIQAVTSNSQNSSATITTTISATTSVSTINTSTATINSNSLVVKKTFKPGQKLVPVNISSTLPKKVQTTPSFTITALPTAQKSTCKEEKPDIQMSEEMQVEKTDFLDDEIKGFAMSPNDSKSSIDMKNCALDFGMRPRKPCNCTKSQCLKLYCDCFANGEFCNNCNCNNCYNNLESEEYRQKAIRTCLERNPNAFRPKIGKAKNFGLEVIRRHNKGCNCKRSGCLKNYCECYEGKIACSANCKCVGCRNIEDSFDRKSLRKSKADIVMKRLGVNIDEIEEFRELLSEGDKSILPGTVPSVSMHSRRPTTYMTNDLIEAICQCLIAQAADAEAIEGPDSPSAVRHVLDEFSRCLQDFINTTQTLTEPSLPNDSREDS